MKKRNNQNSKFGSPINQKLVKGSIYMLFTGWEVLVRKTFAQGLRNFPRSLGQGLFMRPRANNF